jgi:hypothetical protein
MIFLQSRLIHGNPETRRIREVEKTATAGFKGWRHEFTPHRAILFRRGNRNVLDEEIRDARGDVDGRPGTDRASVVPWRNRHIVRLRKRGDAADPADSEKADVWPDQVD